MKWPWLVALVLPGGLIVVAILEYARRRDDRWADPNLVRQMRTWYEREPLGEEPTIKPLDLPDVKPLKAQKAYTMPMDNLREFGRRREGR